MISYLAGKLVEALPTRITVDVNGVGYDVLIPLSSYEKLPQPGQPVHVLVQLVVREDSHTLYGFMAAEERDLFRLLVNSVSGIGPKTAVNVLSGISVPAFKGAVVNNDIKTLSRISGVGKKTAERIVVELKDKIGIVGAWEAQSAKQTLTAEEQLINDAILAMIGLGYKQLEAHKSIRAALDKLGSNANAEDLVRQALRQQ